MDNTTTRVRFDESVRFDASVRPDETRFRVPVMSSTCLREGGGVVDSHSRIRDQLPPVLDILDDSLSDLKNKNFCI